MEIIEDIKGRTGMPDAILCRAMRVPGSTLGRWRRRKKKNHPFINRPGPKKVEPFDPSALDADIRLLGHGVKRSAGATKLYGRYQGSISRRELSRMVWQVRQDLVVDHRKNLRQIDWLMPGVVWAMDVTAYGFGVAGKIHLHNTQDLGSRYKFSPLVGEDLVGEEIAGYLSEKFFRFGPPLLLKRDNGGNLNHVAVNGVLSEFFVLPLNSPEYYAPYNGAIEESQRELKTCLREKLVLDIPCSPDPIAVYAEVAAHDLNHRLRPCLQGKTSCQAFFSLGGNLVFSRLERREIYDILLERVERILGSMNQFGKVARESAWRIAVKSWLQSRGFIKLHIPKKCHPILPPFFAHE
jgi:transposase InsO family protein